MTTKTKYCIYNRNTGSYRWETLRDKEGRAIAKRVDGLNKSWVKLQKEGYECHKVTVTIKKCKS